MMPVFWASEEGSLTHSQANEFKLKVYGAKYGIEAAVWGAVGIGGIYMYVYNIQFLIRVHVHVCVSNVAI